MVMMVVLVVVVVGLMIEGLGMERIGSAGAMHEHPRYRATQPHPRGAFPPPPVPVYSSSKGLQAPLKLDTSTQRRAPLPMATEPRASSALATMSPTWGEEGRGGGARVYVCGGDS